MRRPLAGLLLAATLLASCTLEPKYIRPTSPVPTAWPQGPAYGPPRAGPPVADLAWRDFFVDPKLRAVIQLALDQNRDLRVAVLNIEEARAQYRIQRADLIPHLDGAATGLYEHSPFGLGALGVTSATGAVGGTGPAGATTTAPVSGVPASEGSEFFRYYSATAGVSNYELDLWGRVRSLTRQALEQYLSTAEAQRSTRISLISEVATDYLTLDADLHRLAMAKQTQADDQMTLDLTRARFNGGIASELDVRQAETAVQQARADVATYTTQGAQDVNALNLVAGTMVPDALLPDGRSEVPPTLADIPAGLSSTVLLQRPDVLQAEHQLKGYNANIGAARAAFFPTIAMTANGGTTSLTLSSLFAPGTGTWTIEPTITLPIFEGGKNVANLKYARAEQKAALAQYEKAIQTAFREVADALAQRGTVDELVSARMAYVDAARGSSKLSIARYQRGTDPYLNTLTAELTLYSAEQELISAQLTRSTNLVTLYRALGGGVR